MPAPKILIVDNEPVSALSLRHLIHSAGYMTAESPSIAACEQRLSEARPHLMLVDSHSCKESTVKDVSRLRETYSSNTLPIILLTGSNDEQERLDGFNAGADDCVSRPYFRREIIARINAVLRRTTLRPQRKVLRYGALSIDFESLRVKVGDYAVSLGPTEFELLKVLTKNKERAMSRQQLRNQLWQPDAGIEDRTIDVHILRLRKALSHRKFEQSIQTVRGTGYRFSLEQTL